MTQMQMGGNIALSGAAVRASLQWNGGPGVPDVDASALLVQTSGKVGSDVDFVFYNQPQHPSGAVRLAGRVAGPPTADQIEIDPARLPATVDRVVVAASATGGTFGQVPDLQLLLIDDASNAVVAWFPMTASSETAFVCAELYRRNDTWKFRAVGQGYASGLAGLASDFGIQAGESSAPPAPAPAPAAPPPPPPAAPPGPPAPTPAAPAAAAPSLDLSAPAAPSPVTPPAVAPPAAPAPAPAPTGGPRVDASRALDLDAPWPPR